MMKRLLLTCIVSFVSGSLFAGQYFQDFSSFSNGSTNFNDGSQLFSTHLGTVARVGDDALLELQLTSLGATDVRSAFLLPDLDNNTPIYAFSAKWSSPVYAPFPTGADGFSFTFGQVGSLNLIDSTHRQEAGYDTGLCFSVQTYRDSRPGFYIHVGTNEIAYVTNSPSQWGVNTDKRHFFEVDWDYYRGMTVRMDNQTLFANVATRDFVPQGGDRFVWAARCGAETEYIRVDNIIVFTGGNLVELPAVSPYFSSGDENPKSFAFDGTNSSFWNASAPGPATIGASFPASTVVAYSLTSPTSGAGTDPKTWTFEGSTNAGGSWTACGNGAGSFAGREETRCWAANSSADFTAYRLNISAANNSSLTAALGELRAYAFNPMSSPWRKITGLQTPIDDLAMSDDGTKIYAFIEGHGIWASHDSGATWFQTPLPIAYSGCIACSGDGNVVAMASDTYAEISYDAGVSWSGNSVYTFTSGPTFMDMSVDGKTMLISGSNASYSTDYGVSWNSSSLGLIGLGGAAVSANGTKMVVAGRGSYGIYTSTNSGASWQQTPAVTNVNYYGLAASADCSIILATEYNGGVHVSTNFGASFTDIPMNGFWWKPAVAANGSRLFINDLDGHAYFSTDHGITWVESDPPDALFSILQGASVTGDGDKAIVALKYSGEIRIYDSPLASASTSVSLVVSNGSPVLSWPLSLPPGTLQSSSSLDGNWVNMSYQIKTDGLGFHVTDLPQNGGNKFYRVVFP